MKKKIIIAVAVIICVIAVVFASGKFRKEETPDNRVSIGEIIETTTKKNVKEEKPANKETEKHSEKETEIKHKDPEKMVQFEIPVLFLDAKYQNNLKKLVRDNGYESATYSVDKKRVIIKLKALSYDLYLIKTGVATISAMCETIESEEFPYVKNLGEYEDDFSHVEILVDSSAYKKAENTNDLFNHISNCCAYYLLQDKNGPDKYTIDICDEKTGNKIESKKFNKNDFLN